MVRTLIVALAVATAPAAAGTLYEEKGVSLEGTVRLVGRDAATCQVLEEHESPETYEATKANHGRPLHVWRLDYGALNASGKALSNLSAHFQIEAEWPPCTNWTGLGQYPGPVQWAGSFETIQRTGGMQPAELATATAYVLAIDGQQPRFRNWQLDFRFGPLTAATEPAPKPATPQPAMPAPAPKGPPPTEQRCHSEWLFDCWLELASHSGCHVWVTETWTHRAEWTGDCSDGLASGLGTLTYQFEDTNRVCTGSLHAGKMQGDWVLRHSAGTREEGPYLNGNRHGLWVDHEDDEWLRKGNYVHGERQGEWLSYRWGKLFSTAVYKDGGVSISFVD